MSNAEEYADSLAAGIERLTAAGCPLGLVDRDTGEWSDDADAILDWINNEETRWEEASGLDYLNDALDIQYVVSSDRSYRAARVCVALGGPTAWIDTYNGQLEVAWWSAPVYRSLPSAFISGLDDALSEYWEMVA